MKTRPRTDVDKQVEADADADATEASLPSTFAIFTLEYCIEP